MNLSLGIVGLPNVGKSTLFNALTKLQVLSANYPFATIEPNVGVVPLKDSRLDTLAKLSGSVQVIPSVVEFVDIAGLVKGASSGLGLGNKFLGHIKEVGAILHLVRIFRDDDIIHVENRIDPAADVKIINSELILKDIETINKRISDLSGKLKSVSSSPKNIKEYARLLEQLRDFLDQGNLAREFQFASEDQIVELSDLHLITLKPMIYVANVNEQDLSISQEELRRELGIGDNDLVLAISAKTESDLIVLSESEQQEYLASVGMSEPGLYKVARAGYQALGLISFFTTGSNETRAWTIRKGTKAPQAASVIHTDFEKNFIGLDVVKFDDFVECGSWNLARQKGKVILQGRDYIVGDGDIVFVKHN